MDKAQPTFEHEVQNCDCIVRVTEYSSPDSGNTTGSHDMSYEPTGWSIEFELLTTKMYPAPQLEGVMSEKEKEEIEMIIIEMAENNSKKP